MIKKTREKIVVALLVALVLVSYHVHERNQPVKIGVLLPLSGQMNYGYLKTLEWVEETVNGAGGIGGKQVEFVVKDYMQENVTDFEVLRNMSVNLTLELLNDPGIKAVAGVGFKKNGPLYVQHRKLLIDPVETPDFIFRAYAKKDYVWVTCPLDVAQTRTIMHLLSQRNTSKVSLLYEDNLYGETFYNWVGFFATELGIEVLGQAKYERQGNVTSAVEAAAKGDPDYIITVSLPEDVVKIIGELERLNSTSKLFLTDQAESQYLINELGEKAEGLEGTSFTADPSSGFTEAYHQKFGEYPPDAAATTYDALMLAVYATARQESTWFEDPADSMKKILHGTGEKIGWMDLTRGVQLILDGELPEISGASGPLDYDNEYGVDPLNSYYSHWRVQDGRFKIVEVISTQESSDAARQQEGASVSRSQASMEYGQLEGVSNTTLALPEKTDTWAVVVASSNEWDNYRHQADALAMYTHLKENGLKDDRIILMLYDDMPWVEENPLKGDVHHTLSGRNLRSTAVVDYSGEDVSPDNLRNILTGNKTSETPVVLESNESSNVFLYLVDHGSPGEVVFPQYRRLTHDSFKDTVELMHEKKMYRQLLVMVDACFGESVALNTSTPGMVYLTGASRNEPSYGAVYDPRIRQWLADEFTNKALTIIKENPDATISELYLDTYRDVIGSHVRLLNYQNFGDTETTRVSEFTTP